jgi:septum formation protein
VLPDVKQELLEKPASKEDNLRMLLDLNGGVCEVVTGLVIGATFFHLGLTILN